MMGARGGGGGELLCTHTKKVPCEDFQGTDLRQLLS